MPPNDEVQMAPRGAICLFVTAAGDSCSERFVGIELGRLSIRHELLTPGLLHLRTIRVPQRLTQQLQALEDRQGLRDHPCNEFEQRHLWLHTSPYCTRISQYAGGLDRRPADALRGLPGQCVNGRFAATNLV